MAGLFLDCNSMVRVNMSGLDFSSLSNMESLFLACRSLQKVVIGDLTAAAARGTWLCCFIAPHKMVERDRHVQQNKHSCVFA